MLVMTVLVNALKSPSDNRVNLLSPFNNLQRLFSGFLLAFANYLCFKTSYL